MGTLKRLLRYLSGTRSFGITYSVPNIPAASFIGFADAAYANTDNRKSTSEYIFIVAGGAITWRSKKQETIALSSTEAEYVALSEAACEASSVKKNLSYSYLFPSYPKIRGIRCSKME